MPFTIYIIEQGRLKGKRGPGHDFSRGPHPNPKYDYNLK